MLHDLKCRGADKGNYDVCTDCDTPVFAKAKTESEYEELSLLERTIEHPMCFVVTATMGDETHFVLSVMREFRDTVLCHTSVGRSLLAAYNVVGPIAAARIERRVWIRWLSFLFIVIPSYVIATLVLMIRRRIK